MPNWCSTSYKVRGNAKGLAAIDHGFREAEKKKNEPWLYDILKELGFHDEDMKNCGNCRGYIVSWEYVKDKGIDIECDTAWSEADGFRQLLENKFDVSFMYVAEEPGMGVFVTNCPDMDGAFFIQASDKGEVTYYRVKPDELPKTISEILGEEINDIDEAKSRVDSYNEENKDNDDYIYINEYQYCDE